MGYKSLVLFKDQIWEITASETGVQRIERTQVVTPVQDNDITRQAAQQITAYLEGQLQTFHLPLDLHGTPFQQQVWDALMQISYGQTMCYSEVAQKIGRPSAVRAVAQAIGKNPCLIVVPCHRVLGKDGSLTGFSAGLDIKKQLLQIEHIPYK